VRGVAQLLRLLLLLNLSRRGSHKGAKSIGVAYRFSIVFSLLDLASAVDLYPDSMVSLDPDPDPHSRSGSESRRAIIMVPTKIGKKLINFIF
jgi:hypothetical protein